MGQVASGGGLMISVHWARAGRHHAEAWHLAAVDPKATADKLIECASDVEWAIQADGLVEEVVKGMGFADQVSIRERVRGGTFISGPDTELFVMARVKYLLGLAEHGAHAIDDALLCRVAEEARDEIAKGSTNDDAAMNALVKMKFGNARAGMA